MSAGCQQDFSQQTCGKCSATPERSSEVLIPRLLTWQLHQSNQCVFGLPLAFSQISQHSQSDTTTSKHWLTPAHYNWNLCECYFDTYHPPEGDPPAAHTTNTIPEGLKEHDEGPKTPNSSDPSPAEQLRDGPARPPPGWSAHTCTHLTHQTSDLVPAQSRTNNSLCLERRRCLLGTLNCFHFKLLLRAAFALASFCFCSSLSVRMWFCCKQILPNLSINDLYCIILILLSSFPRHSYLIKSFSTDIHGSQRTDTGWSPDFFPAPWWGWPLQTLNNVSLNSLRTLMNIPLRLISILLKNAAVPTYGFTEPLKWLCFCWNCLEKENNQADVPPDRLFKHMHDELCMQSLHVWSPAGI